MSTETTDGEHATSTLAAALGGRGHNCPVGGSGGVGATLPVPVAGTCSCIANENAGSGGGGGAIGQIVLKSGAEIDLTGAIIGATPDWSPVASK
jgi:hypothetical protein